MFTVSYDRVMIEELEWNPLFGTGVESLKWRTMFVDMSWITTYRAYWQYILTQLDTFVTCTASSEDDIANMHEIKANANKKLLSADVP
jgi:hypothetical protein